METLLLLVREWQTFRSSKYHSISVESCLPKCSLLQRVGSASVPDRLYYQA